MKRKRCLGREILLAIHLEAGFDRRVGGDHGHHMELRITAISLVPTSTETDTYTYVCVYIYIYICMYV